MRASLAMMWFGIALLGAQADVRAADSGKKLYRWVDAQGQVHYGDRVPAQDAKQGRETINNQGTVTAVVPKQLEGKELEEAEARARAEKAAQDAAVQRGAYDRYLLSSFQSVADLQAAREERLVALDARISLAQKAADSDEKTVAELRARSDKPDASTQKQIDSYDRSLIDNIQAVRKLQQERDATATKYAADIERFKQLRAGTIRVGE
jgi:Domain of unknown function (DUF4124)